MLNKVFSYKKGSQSTCYACKGPDLLTAKFFLFISRSKNMFKINEQRYTVNEQINVTWEQRLGEHTNMECTPFLSITKYSYERN